MSWREEPSWWWSMPECGEEATKQALRNKGSRLGTPLGHPDFVRNQLQHVREHQQMSDWIPLIPDVQSSWCLLLHCAAARANYYIRVVPPELSDEFATSHDNALWMCLSRVLDMPPDACDRSARDVASLPLAFGGMGLRSAVRAAVPACWSSWGDALSMISQRHRTVATTLVHELSGHSTSAHLNAAAQSADQLRGLEGFDVPSWADLAAGVRPNLRNAEDVEPASFRTGWQHEAAARMEWQHRERVVKPVLSESAWALLRAQSGPAAGMSLSAVLSSPQTRIESQLFRVLLLRRFADVAVSLTALAIIVHLALKRGFWEDGDSLWRVLRRAYERQEGESPQTCLRPPRSRQ